MIFFYIYMITSERVVSLYPFLKSIIAWALHYINVYNSKVQVPKLELLFWNVISNYGIILECSKHWKNLQILSVTSLEKIVMCETFQAFKFPVQNIILLRVLNISVFSIMQNIILWRVLNISVYSTMQNTILWRVHGI